LSGAEAHLEHKFGRRRSSSAGLRRLLLVAAVVAFSAACQPAAPAPPGYGCGPALAYPKAHAGPNFVFSCPHDAGGSAAETLSPRYQPDGSFKGGHLHRDPVPGPSRRTVVVYADSFGTEARPVLTSQLRGAVPGSRVVVRAAIGTALCDWLPAMTADQRLHPRLVVLAFFGNQGTPCMAGRDYTVAWDSDYRFAVDLWLARGVRVLLVGDPSVTGQPARGAISPPGDVLRDAASALAAAEPGTVRYVNAGASLLDPATRRYGRFLPCLRGETSTMGCGAPPAPPGQIVVRQNDQIHLCSTTPGAGSACPRYSSGVQRWSNAVARAASTWR
jgi:hypothetical protein